MKAWVLSLVVICFVALPAPLSAATCESLSGLNLQDSTITSAQVIAAGAFPLPPGSMPQGPWSFTAYNELPSFCRLQGIIRPSSDSNIEFEVWLPTSGWNGKYQGVGNGGFAGGINYAQLAEAISKGYASSSTDTGHKSLRINAQWGLGHPEKIADFGFRAIHETAKNAKAIIRALYGSDARYSYFSSCSNGGRQALMEAQRYPEDYDGIIAGAPWIFVPQSIASFIWNMQAIGNDKAGYISAGKMPAIESAVLAACDSLDGVNDGIIDDPTRCNFDPSALLCPGIETDACLTPPQITAIRKIYAGPRDSKGTQIYPGILPGGESGANGWSQYLTGQAQGMSGQHIMGVQAARFLVFQDPSWDFRAFDFDSGLRLLQEKTGNKLSADDPELRAFKKRGGKLILYHGWSDSMLAPLGTVKYFQSVVSKMGKKETDEFFRLYMIPGMQHCTAGPGPSSFGQFGAAQGDAEHNISAALERWVEKGTAPEKIIAAKYKTDDIPTSGVVRTRPVCPYPQVAKYKGSGSTDEAANYVCAKNR
jgi:hypothetical protein